jgi:hypothetical protein
MHRLLLLKLHYLIVRSVVPFFSRCSYRQAINSSSQTCQKSLISWCIRSFDLAAKIEHESKASAEVFFGGGGNAAYMYYLKSRDPQLLSIDG